MSLARKSIKALIVGAVALTVANVGQVEAMGNMDGKEKCFGIVKAGKNMCGRPDGKHACMHLAEVDSDPQEWIAVPKGLCEKIVGGSLEAGEADVSDEKHGHKH